MGNRRCQPDLKARNAPLVIGNAVRVVRIAVGEAADELLDDGKDPAAEGAGREGRKEAWRGHFERLSGKPDGGRRPGAHECRDRRTRRRGGDLRSDAADPSPQRCAVDPDASRHLLPSTGRRETIRAQPSHGGRPCSLPRHRVTCPCRSRTVSARHAASHWSA